MIINELERNYNEIKNMHFKLEREEREDQTKDKNQDMPLAAS